MDEMDTSDPQQSKSDSNTPPIGGEISETSSENILPRKKIIQPIEKADVQPAPAPAQDAKPAVSKVDVDSDGIVDTPPTPASAPTPTKAAVEPKPKVDLKQADAGETAPIVDKPATTATSETTSSMTGDKPLEGSTIVHPDSEVTTANDEPQNIAGAESSSDYSVKIDRGTWKKRGLIALGVSLVLLILVGGYWFFIKDDSTNNSSVETEQTVVEAKPIELTFYEETLALMQYSDDEGKSWRQVDEETVITEGLWLRNQDASLTPAIIKAGNTEFRLASGTVVTVDSSTDQLLKLGMREGSVYVRKIGKPSEKIVVVMDNLSAELEGDAMMTRENNDFERSYAFSGLVKDELNNLNVEEGEQFTFEKDGSRKTASDVSLEEIRSDEFVSFNRARDLETLEIQEDNMGILFDLEPPALLLSSPKTGESVKIESGNLTASVTFTGVSEADAQVIVSTNTDKKIKVTADDDGSFSAIMNVDETDSAFNVSAEDRAGNKTEVQLELTVIASAEIDLSAVAISSVGIKASWEFKKGSPSAAGLRLLWSDQSGVDLPVTGEGTATPRGPCGDLSYGFKQLAASAVTADVCLQDGGDYYFRLCSYVAASNSCEALSNEVKVKAPAFSG